MNGIAGRPLTFSEEASVATVVPAESRTTRALPVAVVDDSPVGGDAEERSVVGAMVRCRSTSSGLSFAHAAERAIVTHEVWSMARWPDAPLGQAPFAP